MVIDREFVQCAQKGHRIVNIAKSHILGTNPDVRQPQGMQTLVRRLPCMIFRVRKLGFQLSDPAGQVMHLTGITGAPLLGFADQIEQVIQVRHTSLLQDPGAFGIPAFAPGLADLTVNESLLGIRKPEG
jgi:hypothetical protein